MKNSYLDLCRQTVPALLCCVPLCMQPAAEAQAAGRRSVEFSVAVAPLQTITGRVVDEKGEGLPGVTVLVKGTSNGTSTGADGSFTLDAPADATLLISSVGYVSKEVAVNGQSNISVTLATDVQQLSEAVVVGYLVQERQNVTGAVSTVTAQEVRRAPVASVGEAIQGRVAGVQVTNSGQPGQAPNINIRGLGTIASGSGPLYVIDGLWVQNQGGQRDFNPADVESVQILKDAASLAPYGASGANGVIIITTKKGKAGTTAINFSANGGVQNLIKRLDLTNAAQWAAINNQAYDNAGLPRQPFAANLPAGIDTDWQEEFFKQGSVQDYNLGFSGGGPTSTFNVAGGYFNQKGTVQGPEFERYSLRVNTGFTRGRFKIGENAMLSRTNQTRLNVIPFYGSPFYNVVQMLPVNPVFDRTVPGGFGIGNPNASTFGLNPIASQTLLNDTGTSNRLQGNVYGEVSIFDFLRYRLNLATEFHAFQDQQRRRYGIWRQNDITQLSNFGETQGNDVFGMAENTLTLDKSFGDHNLTVVGGYSRQRFEQNLTRGVNFGYGEGPNYFWALDAGNQTPQAIGSSYVWGKESFFGQLSYDYDQRYLVTAAFRRDGSSRFDANNRWGNFGAASVGWRVSKEKFFENLSGISDLKLRASFGRLGNDLVNGPYGGSYRSQGFINTNANYGFGGVTQNGALQTNYASTGILWESRQTTNVGFDATFLSNRLSLSADYYVSQTFDALVNPSLPLTLGNASDNPYRNIGKLENKGFELVLGYNDDRGKFRYGASGNLTTLKNTVLDLGTAGGEGSGAANFFTGGPRDITRTEKGYEIGSFYLYQFDGIYQSGDANIPAGLAPGDVRYKDINGDGIITDLDRTHVGRVFPKLQYGLNLNLGYGGFDLTAFIQGVQGNDVMNLGRFLTDNTADNSNYRADFSPWTTTNPSTTTPRAIIAGGPQNGFAAGNNARFNSTRWLEDGSYLRMKNVQLGYTVPKAALERAKYVSSLRVYVTGQNLFTVTDYSGYDPETVGTGSFNSQANNLSRGIDEGSYPNLRSFTLGIQAGF
ncbi:SusC/RagA family TonB-linked outer membrane protein [Hymenobacter arizonensis]|uniref:TonB-linked outer membrane protein, SusC/RagA family n=1 Tax=Hymenobacter arizonensis TaxID=1227077 RepID=A0A1I5YZZ0_HYMAR|nr:TonB-dependent receptor [Hymenobacter arizonensis]SFQ49814.1 TonB-linked outer membrane protein, SusC/RagA family [Hymenobacter arizonensis]